jgi:cyclopropane-fatty-acyl-phospholipid synthase
MAIGHHAVRLPLRDRVRGALEHIFEGVAHKDFAVCVGDCPQWRPPDSGPPRFRLRFASPEVLRRVFLHPGELSLGEAYIHGELEVQGSLFSAFDLIDDLLARARTRTVKEQMLLAAWLLQLPARTSEYVFRLPSLSGVKHSRPRDQQAIAYHYELPAEFFSVWLDSAMVYSCAYFRRAEDSLELAQQQKMELVCRKLRLRPGQRMLDLGCGWGGLVIHAAQRPGVHATGVTLSAAQARWAQSRIAALGLENQCRVVHADYRAITQTGEWDAVASVGMFEHVGEANLGPAMQQVYRLLRPGGAFLLHGITRKFDQPLSRGSFSTRYVFPDGELEPVSMQLQAAEGVGFEIRDVENLREHYALTCRHWLDRLTGRRAEALQHVDLLRFRIWELYLAGSVHQFENGTISLHQSLLVRPGASGESGLPLTREDWYPARSEVV